MKFYRIFEKTELINWIFGLPDMKFYKNEMVGSEPSEVSDLFMCLCQTNPEPMKTMSSPNLIRYSLFKNEPKTNVFDSFVQYLKNGPK
jgi:hypothetical protein